MATVEWYVVPAVALYLAKPFIDKFLAKASDDLTAIAYPKFKQALQQLVQRLYINESQTSRLLLLAGRRFPTKVHGYSEFTPLSVQAGK